MKSEMEIVREYVRRQGRRRTPEREMILREIFAVHEHFDVEELYLRLRHQGAKISKASIYRALRLFLECGLVREVDFSDGHWHYEHFYGHVHHYLLRCLGCGEIVEFEEPELKGLEEHPGNETTYSNAGKTEKQGIELSGAVVPVEGLAIGGAYTYSHFTYVVFTEPVGATNVDRSGNWLPYIPWHQYMLYAGYRHTTGFKARIETNTWGRYYVDNANSFLNDGYSYITNANIGYETKNLDVIFDVYNLFDKRYAIEVTKDTSPFAGEKYRPGAPRSFMVREAYRF